MRLASNCAMTAEPDISYFEILPALYWLTEQRYSKAKTAYLPRTSPSPTWQHRRLLCQGQPGGAPIK